MPTENRSSNTEMVSVPRDKLQAWQERFSKAQIFRESSEVQALLAQPAEQHQGDLVAVVGIVPGTDYKSLDFKADLQQLAVGAELYTHAGPGEVERLRSCLDAWKEVAARRLEDWKHAVEANERQHAQLAERDALCAPLAKIFQSWLDDDRMPTFSKGDVRHIIKALSASAEPTYPRVEIVRAHKHTCASCKEGAEHAPCDCGAIVDGVAVKIEPSAALERKP